MKQLLITALLLCVAAGAKAQDFSDVEIGVTPLRGGIFMLSGAGGNVGVSAGDDGLLIIDDDYAPVIDKIRAALDGIAPDTPVNYVINTHFHGDHTGGNGHFHADDGAAIVAHENVRVRLLSDEAISPDALPTITYENGVRVYFNNDTLTVDHLPGHTDGDSVVYFTKANVLHTGDLLFNGRFPYVDFASGGSVRQMIASLDHLATLIDDNTQVIPGHGPLADRASLLRAAAMMRETLGIVQARISEGASLDAIIAAGVPEKFAQWSWRFIDNDKWLRTLYTELTDANPK
ncbi:beta-lactamase domain protein [Luminiphilus syltensis NOR5-1B]|uniref:beta-lactamase n=1 Tax=Luminiphilus syltensis NOR5-1B TaxID=565045 RepID=B8KXG0_9GAMM|nr:MBL fold metallo-hydrolase [Luminiphilus syltensis]EED34438.1 beta-lactamase domain protein [Luminiphilus syltensis NOR5-1B]